MNTTKKKPPTAAQKKKLPNIPPPPNPHSMERMVVLTWVTWISATGPSNALLRPVSGLLAIAITLVICHPDRVLALEFGAFTIVGIIIGELWDLIDPVDGISWGLLATSTLALGLTNQFLENPETSILPMVVAILLVGIFCFYSEARPKATGQVTGFALALFWAIVIRAAGGEVLMGLAFLIMALGYAAITLIVLGSKQQKNLFNGGIPVDDSKRA